MEFSLEIAALLLTPPPSPPHFKTTLEGAPHHGRRLLYLITTTYTRDTQKADLTTLCHTLKHVQSLVWIVMENSASKSRVVRVLLERCNVSAVHLTVSSPETVKSTRNYSPKVTGVLHRNAGLKWVREHCSREGCGDGVVYFGDDDDRYDLRFFDEVSTHIFIRCVVLRNAVQTLLCNRVVHFNTAFE